MSYTKKLFLPLTYLQRKRGKEGLAGHFDFLKWFQGILDSGDIIIPSSNSSTNLQGLETFETGLTGTSFDLLVDFGLSLTDANSFKIFLNGQRLIKSLDYTVLNTTVSLVDLTLVPNDYILIEY